MSDKLEPQRCDPQKDVPQLVVQFQELARARESTRQANADVLDRAAKEILGAVYPPAGLVATLADLAKPVPIGVAPANASQAEKYAHYERILIARGYTLQPGVATVLALRGMNNSGAVHGTTSSPTYDDTMVVLKRDAQGNPQVTTLAGSTHADGPIKKEGGKVGVPDVTFPKDGKADVGMLNPGEYRLVRRSDGYNGAEAWDVRTLANSGAVPSARDTNQDGRYSDAERSASRDAGHVMTGVMIHQGDVNTPQSAGCLNLSRQSTVYPEFVKAVGNGTEGRLVVLDANEK